MMGQEHPTSQRGSGMKPPPRILFVDDEELARRVFVSIGKRHGYEVILAADGVEALAVLASGPVDAMVTDLHMPRLGGFELLKLARAEHPTLPCVLTSGMAHSGDLLRAFETGLAVFVSKPYRPSEMVDAIGGALGKARPRATPRTAPTVEGPAPTLDGAPSVPPATPGASSQPDLALMGRQIVASFRSGKSKLPDPHPMTQELHRLRENPELGATAVYQMIQGSPILSARTMMMANSAYYGASRPVSNVKDAVRRLGNRRVLDLVQTVVQRGLYSTNSPAFSLLLRESWSQTVFEAHLARELAKGRAAGSAEDVYLAALMHNLGEALMLRIMAKQWGESPVTPADVALMAQVTQRHHEELGRLVLTSWKFPPACVRIASGHHDVHGRGGAPRPSREDAAVIHILNICAHASKDRWSRSSVSAMPEIDLEESMAATRLDKEGLDGAVTQAVRLSKAFLAEASSQEG